MKYLKLLLVALSLILLIASCEKNDSGEINVNNEVYSLMQEHYLWYDQMPTVDPNGYATPIELMDALRVTPPDKWSYVTTRTEFEAYYNQGAYVGFGFGSGFNANGELIITFVFNSSPLAAKGIGRGWQIVTIDGQTPTADNYSSLVGASTAGVSKTFQFKSPTGTSASYTFEKAEIAMNTVLTDSVYTFGATKVGYFVLESFITNTTKELDAVFADFKSKGVTELIVDLRYNGGGQVDVSNYLANLIGGSAANGGVYAKSCHNNKHSDNDTSLLFKSVTNTLTLNRVVFITTNQSASASELVINGLKPFMDVALVGEKTHGKPVGMYAFKFNDPSIDWMIVPICFSMKNANNEGDYFGGIPVNVTAADDVMTNFGDINETSLNAALAHLGVITKSAKKTQTVDFESIVGKGLGAEIGAW
ncbi:MAG: hypothetical protein H6536_00955 [Bacteroidales bacterium]|nr:hypothetical protein [Bacteroidales bacterium]